MQDIKMELACCTYVLLSEIADKRFKRKDIAMTYALALCSSEETNWKTVNKAIVERWSMSGLRYIKNLAWSGKCFKRGLL